jgi:predicted nucleic acid-binding protein
VILVDSSVWIDYFNGRSTPQTEKLDQLLGAEDLAIGDLILVEVLQGFREDREFESARRLLLSLSLVDLCGPDIAIQAARNYRSLRSRGFTIRKTIDCAIATCCIERGYQLLHSDKDFDVFKRLRLKTVA